MSIPGFSAETSLGKASTFFRRTVDEQTGSAGVVPQLWWAGCFPTALCGDPFTGFYPCGYLCCVCTPSSGCRCG
jgi:hypothetical protein